jgi:hypothetical protein
VAAATAVRRTALAVAGVLLLAGAAAFATGAPVPLLTPPCAAGAGGTEVGLSRLDARAVTSLGAAATRDGVPLERVADAVAVLLGGEDPAGPDGGAGTADPGAVVADPAAALAAAPEAARDERSTAVATAVLGLEQGGLTCRADHPAASGEPEGPSGLTPRAERLRAEMEAAFGPQPLGGFAPGGVSSGHIPGSAHYEGRAIDVFFRPVTPEGTAHGWALAHWLVARAEDLDVVTVIFDRQVWSARRSVEGWRPYRHPSGDTTNPVLAHEDHVHVDVAR